MNYIQTNETVAARDPSQLVRVWRSSGDPGMPLVSAWVRAEFTKLRPTLPTRRAFMIADSRSFAARQRRLYEVDGVIDLR